MGARPPSSQPLVQQIGITVKAPGVHSQRPLEQENGAWLQRTVSSTWPGDSVSEARSSAAASSAAVRFQHGRQGLGHPLSSQSWPTQEVPTHHPSGFTGVNWCRLLYCQENTILVTFSLKSWNPWPHCWQASSF